MKRKALFTAVMVLWVTGIVLWPKAVHIERPAQAQRAVSEALYKTVKTQANFGVLGARMYQSTEGKKRWYIRSEFAELYRQENYTFLAQVLADFFAERTGNVITTTSRHGKAYLDAAKVELEGNVVIRSNEGYLFRMPRLSYDGKAHQFTTDEPVDMRGPDEKKPALLLRGKGLVAHIDREHFILKKNVVAQKRLRPNAQGKEEWMKISAQSGEFFTSEQRSVFIRKVHSLLPGLGIDSDWLELTTHEGEESLAARGNVVLRNRERLGYADRAFLELGKNRVVLEGRARVDSKNNQIRGKRILLYTDEDRLEVEEAEGRVTS